MILHHRATTDAAVWVSERSADGAMRATHASDTSPCGSQSTGIDTGV